MPDVVAKEANTPEQRRVRRNRWIGIASSIVVAGFIAAIAYFGVQFLRDTSYQDERAFRVLGHIVGQFGNLQEAIAGALQLAPGSQDCNPSPGQDLARANYARRLALRGVRLERTPKESSQRAIGLASEPFRIDTSSPARMFYVSSCGLTLSGPLLEQIPIFINQELFERVAIATQTGTVLTSIPQGLDQSQHVQLHNVAGTDLFGGNVAGVLHNAAVREARTQQKLPGKEDEAVTTDQPAPGSATVYAEDVGGQPFRIFVLPFEPIRRASVDGESVPRLYLLGLKRQNVLQSMSDALGSGGALFVTLGVLLCVLFWPFISLRFSSPQEAIAPTQVVAILLALLLIPALLATAGFSIWTRYRLTLWADQQAEIYARRIEQTLIQEMDWGLHVLEPLAVQFASNEVFRQADFMMKSCETASERCAPVLRCWSRPCAPPYCSENISCAPPLRCGGISGFTQQHCSNVLCSSLSRCLDIPSLSRNRCPGALPLRVPDDWSPIRSAAPLNLQGRSSGLTLNFFRGPPVDELNLEDREYYRAIVDGDEWLPENLWPHTCSEPADHRYVAQRLFNRSDAARALQLAVPIDTADGERIGLVTGDTRAYGLSAAMRPPLLRFAIFDHHNGAVLFHTNDERSLAENLIVETEGNSSLIEAMQKRASGWSQPRILLDDHFTGRYIGATHRFYHRAVPGAPWGLVVFYETDSLNTIVLQTAVATLATYFLIITIAALVFGLLVVVLPVRADIAVLRWVWPKWSWREQYRIIGSVSISIVVVLAALAIGRLNGVGWFSIVVGLLLALLVLNFAARRGRALAARLLAPRAPSVTLYERSYVRCVFGVLCLVSAVPAICIAIGYHDTSLHAFIRDELLHAARDEEQRRRTLSRDDRRFNYSTSSNLQHMMELSRTLPVPGYRHDTSANVEVPRWSLTDSDPALWLSECGPPMLNRVRRAIWALSTARQVQRAFGSSVRRPYDDSAAEIGTADKTKTAPRAEYVDRSDGCPAIAVRAWRRSEDGTRVSVAMPLAPINQDFLSVGSCQPGQSNSRICRDPELHTLYNVGSGAVLGSTTIACALLILLLSAHVSRRLFGIRIPFSGRFVSSAADAANASELLDAELQLVELKNTAGLQMTSKDEADWRAQKCTPIYERMWNSLDSAKAQQLLLLHLAHGRYANPENQTVIEQLLRRGYIALAPWPRIVEPGFADFIRRVHPSHDLDELRFEASHTPWSQWRTPILIIVIIVAGLLMWLAGSAMHILVGVLGGIATLFGSITQVTSFIHRDRPAPDK